MPLDLHVNIVPFFQVQHLKELFGNGCLSAPPDFDSGHGNPSFCRKLWFITCGYCITIFRLQDLSEPVKAAAPEDALLDSAPVSRRNSTPPRQPKALTETARTVATMKEGRRSWRPEWELGSRRLSKPKHTGTYEHLLSCSSLFPLMKWIEWDRWSETLDKNLG